MSKPNDKWEDKEPASPPPNGEDEPSGGWHAPPGYVPPEPEPEPPEPEGDVLWVDPGDAPLVIKNRSNLTIQGRGGVVTLSAPGEDVLWIHASERITVRDLVLRNGYRGCRITDSEHVRLENVQVQDCAQQGFLTVNVRELDMVRCSAWNIRDEHCCYLSENFTGGTLFQCEFRDSGGSCFQANAEGADQPITDVVLEECTIESEFAVAAMGAKVLFDRGSITGRINVDTVRGWEARVTLDGCDHEGSVNEFNGSTVETV